MPALARAARRLGAAIVESCAVRTVETEAGRVRAGSIPSEAGSARRRSCSRAGAWTSYFASNLGLDLPQLTVRATAGRTNPVAGPEMPAVYSPQLCIRRRADGGYTVANGDLVEHYVGPRSVPFTSRSSADAIRGRSLLAASARTFASASAHRADSGELGGKRRWTADEVTPFEKTPGAESAAVEIALRRISARLPVQAPRLAEAGMAEFWGGMIDVTPDAVPYICEAPAPRGLFVGTG